MGDNVELSVRSQLKKIVEELQDIAKASSNVGDSLSESSKKVGEDLNNQVKKTETFMGRLRSLSGRVADQIKGDFRSLVAINSLRESLKLSEQFRGSVTQALNLSNVIRRLGPIFGLTAKQAGDFQSRISKSLGEIGASSEAAANALSGLSETPVRDQNALIEYSKSASELGTIGGQKGQEGGIAKGLSDLVVARGGNPNDLSQMSKARDEVLRIMNATGRTATDVEAALKDLYSSTNAAFKPMLKKGGSSSLAAASLIGGKDATTFLEKYLGMTPAQRAGSEAQGLGKIMGSNGQLNLGAMNATMTEAKRRGLNGDAQSGLTTMGMSDEEARGFIRLTEAMNQNGAAIEAARTAVVDINEQYHRSMGLGDSFRASIHRILGTIPGVGKVTQGVTDTLQKLSQSDLGAGATVLGGGLLAAILAGGGLKGVGKGLLGGAAKGAAAQALTGKEVQPVYVVNAAEIGGGLSGAAGALSGGGKIAGALGTAGLIGGAVSLGVAAGSAASSIVEPGGLGDAARSVGGEGLGDSIDKLEKTLSNWMASFVGMHSSPQRVKVELNKQDLKQAKQPTKGASYGP